MAKWYEIPYDGAPLKCVDCNIRDDKPKIKIEGIWGAHHIECLKYSLDINDKIKPPN